MLKIKKCPCKCGCSRQIMNQYYEICIFCTLGEHFKESGKIYYDKPREKTTSGSKDLLYILD